MSDSPPDDSGTAASPFDLGSWTQTLSRFGANAEPRGPGIGTAAGSRSINDEFAQPGVQPVAVLDQIKLEWHRFIEHLHGTSLHALASHLHACALLSCSPGGVVELVCCRKFSYEELLHDAVLLEEQMAGFYHLPLKPQIRYDAGKDACTREKSLFSIFRELSEQNEVIRYLITEFGAELVY